MSKEGWTQALSARLVQDLLWGTVEDNISPATHYSLSAEPQHCPRHSELDNTMVNKTICAHPKLFKIICNIKFEKFKELLLDHTNQPFMWSVIIGLTEHFWPWAEKQDGYCYETRNIYVVRAIVIR